MAEQFMEQIVRSAIYISDVLQKERKEKMRKWVLSLQIEPGQEVFFLFGDKSYEIVMKGKCVSITISEDKVPRYLIKAIKCVYSKSGKIKKGELQDFSFTCKNCNINTGDGMGAWPVFTSQEAYKEWKAKRT